MSREVRKLNTPPIVEAILDINCEYPPEVTIASLEAPARKSFLASYPEMQKRHFLEHKFEDLDKSKPKGDIRHDLDGFLFRNESGTQLVQVRAQGFSFNRLGSYSTLDDYLEEIELRWREYLVFSKPIKITSIRLRYINRIVLNTEDGKLDIHDYFNLDKILPDEERVSLATFFNRYLAVEKATGNVVKVILTSEDPNHKTSSDQLSFILDLTTETKESVDIQQWSEILERIGSLRGLAQHIFFNTLEDKCLQMYQ